MYVRALHYLCLVLTAARGQEQVQLSMQLIYKSQTLSSLVKLTDLWNYNLCTKKDVSRICIPLEALKCSNMSCSIHQKDIDCFYYDIVNTVYECVRKCIPVKKHSEHSIVGWNENVKHYHVIARSEFKFWKQNNMPRRGSILGQ